MVVISRSGLAKRASIWEDCWDVGSFEGRIFLIGRRERRSCEVGIDSGIGSDIVVSVVVHLVDQSGLY